jgi:hypothetical protein
VAVAVATLALGIGANTALFSVVHGVLLEPLPYPEPERLVRVFEDSARFPLFPISPANFLDHRAALGDTGEGAVYLREDAELTAGERSRRIAGMRVSAGFFGVLSLPPQLGRDVEPTDELPGAEAVAVLGHRFWQRHFEADPGAVGRTVDLDGVSHKIVGVAPPGLQHVGGSYRSLPHGAEVDVWRPLTLDPENAHRGAHFLNLVVRLAPGVSHADALARLNATHERLAAEYPATNSGWKIVVVPLSEEIVGAARPMLRVLMGVVALVLAIAVANVANLLLVRATARRHEIGMRRALGAGTWRLVRQTLSESFLLAGAGTDLPWTGYDENMTVLPEDRLGEPGAEMTRTRFHIVTPGYFRTLGVPVVSGREFDGRDDREAPPRVIVNRRLAELGWPGRDPVGRRLTWSLQPDKEDLFEVVGVVGDVKDSPRDADLLPAIFFPHAQQTWRTSLVVAVRTAVEPRALAAALRDELRALDPDLPLAEVRTLDEVAGGAYAEPRFLSVLLGGFAAVALALAVVGLYGVMSYAVGRRGREMAVRQAMGARAVQLVRLVLAQGMRIVAVGAVLGVAGALAATELLRGLLYGVEPGDPWILCGVVAVLAAVTVAANLVPARRASTRPRPCATNSGCGSRPVLAGLARSCPEIGPVGLRIRERSDVVPGEVDEDAVGVRGVRVVRGLSEVEIEVPGRGELLVGHVLQVEVILAQHLHRLGPSSLLSSEAAAPPARTVARANRAAQGLCGRAFGRPRGTARPPIRISSTRRRSCCWSRSISTARACTTARRGPSENAARTAGRSDAAPNRGASSRIRSGSVVSSSSCSGGRSRASSPITG